MSVSGLIDRLCSFTKSELVLLFDLKQESDNIISKLKRIQIVLRDAESEADRNSILRSLLKELEDVLYEIDDALDDWEMELMLETYEDGSDVWEKVRSVILSICLCFKHVIRRREIALNSKGLIHRLDKIIEDIGMFNFLPRIINNNQDFEEFKSTNFVDESRIYGRDSEKEDLVQELLRERANNIEVISIVGVGGIGKTALAQLAFNDNIVGCHFELKIWVSVPNPFNASVIARAILENAGKNLAHISTLEALTQLLKEMVSGKRFLLVLDDVSTVNPRTWEWLKKCLCDASGSRILVTTRSELVARMMAANQRRSLGLLSDSTCGAILNGIALRGQSEEHHETLRHIGLDIAKRCNGLPLAAKVLGSMLAYRHTVQEWRDVQKSSFWKYEDEVADLTRLLRFHYNDLSPTLKRCFQSCAMFEKGSEIHLDELNRIWTAEGYLSATATQEQVQSLGLLYFDNLAMGSFFQELKRDGVYESKVCKTHDIMHDFATNLSSSEHCYVRVGMSGKISHDDLPLNYHSLERIRTFVSRHVYQEELPSDLFSRLRRVRLLIISDCNLEEVPQEVGKLFHLRYLDLSGNPINELPETLCDLYKLQTLCLKNCCYLCRLPQAIDKLVSLRHLLTQEAESPIKFPQELQRLTGLWTLGDFTVGRNYNKLGYLENLNQLQGLLYIAIEDMNEVEDIEEAERANLRCKDKIQTLKLDIRGEVRTGIMEALQPPPNLQRLEVVGQSHAWLYHWVNESYLNNIKSLVLAGGHVHEYYIIPLGKLSSLEELIIGSIKFKCLSLEFLGITIGSSCGDEKIGALEVGGFPKLKKLVFENCDDWEEWEDIEENAQDNIFPCLLSLTIQCCPRLKRLPQNLLGKLPSLQSLKIIDSEQLEKVASPSK